MKILRKLAKFILYFLTAIIGITLVIMLMLRIPAVQTAIAKKAVHYLEETIGTPVRIAKVKINFMDNATLEGFYVEDQNNDTLLYVQSLSVNVGFFNLINGKIDIDKIDLQGVTANISQTNDSIFNFQFIADAFASDSTEPKDTANNKSIDFNIDRITLTNIRNKSVLLSGTFNTSLKSLDLKVDAVDLNSLTFKTKKLHIDGLITHLVLPPSKAPVDTSKFEYPLVGLPFSLDAKDISIANSQVTFQVVGSKKETDFNPENLVADVKNLVIKSFLLDSVKANASITSAQMVLDNTINIDTLSGILSLTPTDITWKKLQFSTAHSSLHSEATVHYTNFADLLKLDHSITIDLPSLLLNLSMEELLYMAPQLRDVEFLSDYLAEQFVFEAQLNGGPSNVNITSLKASLGKNWALASGTIQNPIDPDHISCSNMAVELFSAVPEIEKFVDLSTVSNNLDRFGDVHFKSSFSGNIQQLNLHQLSLSTDGSFKTKLSGVIRNLTDAKLLTYKLSFDELVTSSADINVFVDSLPEMVNILGTISYTGKLEGSMTQYILHGALHSIQGMVKTDFDVHFNDSFTNAKYDGSIEFVSFNLGSLLANDSLGHLDASITLKGSGLTGNQLNTQLKANIKRLRFNGYVYRDASIQGSIKNEEFNGEFNIQDQNIAVNFKGLLNLSDSLPMADFEAHVKKLDLYALHLSEKPLQVKLDIKADLKGKNVDEIAGEASIHGIELYNGNEYYKPDSFIFKTTNISGQRKLTLQSPIVELEVDGNFDLSIVDEIILAFADSYFPFSQYIAGEANGDYTTRAAPKIKNEKLNLSLRLIEPTKLTDFFNIPLEQLDYATLDFSMSAPDNLLDFKLYVPRIRYDGMLMDSFFLTGENRQNELRFTGSIDSIRLSSMAYIPQTGLNLSFKDQKGMAQLYLKNDSNKNALGLNLQLTKTAELYQVQLNEPLYLNGKEWQVNTTTPLSFSTNHITYPSIEFTHVDEYLSLQGRTEELVIALSGFKLSNFTHIIQLDSIAVDGEMNGKLQVKLTQSAIMGNLIVEQIHINQNSLGTLDIKMVKEDESIDADVRLSGNDNDVRIKTKYQISSQIMDGTLAIERLHLQPFEPFLKDYIRNTNGYFTGSLAIGGTMSKPKLNGRLFVDKMDAQIVYLGSKYTFENTEIKISEQHITTNIKMLDVDGERASLTGRINHTYFQDFDFDLYFKAKNFKFLDTKQSHEAWFYGMLVANVNAKITGNIDLPIIKADVLANPKTELFIQLLSEEAVLSQENYIIFIDGADKYSMEALDSLAMARYKVDSYVDLTLYMETHQDAQFSIIIDPLTQDRLTVKGDAKLNVKVPPSGEITIHGTFVVRDGSYRFSYQDLLKRNFEIIPGGNITFNGSPYNASMNIQAKYQTKASVLPLLNQDINSLSAEDRNQYKKAAEVDVILTMKGSLSEPELMFDIQIPKYNGGATQSGIASSLQRIKQNESDLNKQVFSLMLFNSFTGDQSKGNVSGAGTSTAIRSVGNLINRQLNELIGKSSGFEVNFEVDNYNSGLTNEKQNTVTEVDLGLSRKLLNDRISISIGGNVDLQSDALSNQNLSNITGDFVVVYHLTMDGKYQIKAFQRNDYDALNESNFWKTGIGFTYKTVFGKKNKNESVTP